MARDLDMVARLLAFEKGCAVPIATHRQVAIRSDALVVCPIAMAGEDTTMHAVAYGRIGQRPTILYVPDPRIRDDQYGLFERLGAEVEAVFSTCRMVGSYPQVWVSSAAAATHLDILADRLRYNRENLVVKRFGELLSFATERYPIAGQQALQTATGALRTHWATGQQVGEDEHLGARLAWHEPPAHGNVLAAVAEAELVPMGVKTDPSFDRDVLEPLVTRYNQIRRAGASRSDLVTLDKAIHHALAPVVLQVYAATQQAIAILLASEMPPLPSLTELERIESEAFTDFMNSRDAGYGLPLRDRPKAAVYKFVARESAVENVESAIRLYDRIGRARAKLDGNILTGQVVDVRRRAVSPRRTEFEVDVESNQKVLRIRRGDELHWAGDPRLKLVVINAQRSGQKTLISLMITAGMQAVGVPAINTVLELVSSVPDWSRTWRARGQLENRISQTPWTHDSESAPPASHSRQAPGDPLALVEGLR